MPPPARIDSRPLNAMLVLTSGVLWCLVWLLNDRLMDGLQVAPGIDLIFLPAGFRPLIVLIFGFWGALGIALADPLMFLQAFGSGSVTEIVINALISGFAPYLTVKAFCRVAGIQSSLLQLRPIHLPLLALSVSIVTPVLFNLHFILRGREPASEFAHNLAAMSVGDFVGCFLVIGLVRLGLAVARRQASR